MPYYLIRPDEDGNPIRDLTEPDLTDVLTDPADWGIKRFFEPTNWDTNYWPEGTACLIKGEVVIPEPNSGFKLPEETTR